MPARQPERKLAVVKIAAIRIHAIVTGKTVAAPIHLVDGGEGRIHLAMTIRTDFNTEGGDVLGMTIAAEERLTRDLELVAVQRVSQTLMRKIRRRGDGEGASAPR